MKDNDGKKISVRLDAATYAKLTNIVEARGISESDAIRLCINGAKIVQIGDSKQLAQEFCKIRKMLETHTNDSETEGKVDTLCRYIKELLLTAEELPE